MIGKGVEPDRRKRIVEELETRMWGDLLGRLGGSMTFRLILQPMMAACFAIHDGLRDAHEKKSAHFWSIVSNPSHRQDLLREGWKAISKVFILAFVLDAVYQYLAFRWFYPGEALMVAFSLAFIPYLLIRGPVNRVAR